ncbi:MAG: hypothetical protein Tsb002_37500 [Wenzhouxiangellaceae bacterium]
MYNPCFDRGKEMSIYSVVIADQNGRLSAVCRQLLTLAKWTNVGWLSAADLGAEFQGEDMPQVALMVVDEQMLDDHWLRIQHWRIQYGWQLLLVAPDGRWATRAFALGACDYVVPPVSIDRLTWAVERVEARLQWPRHHSQHQPSPPLLSLRSVGRIRLVEPDDIVHVCAAGSYVTLHLSDGEDLLHRESLKNMQRLLGNAFLRVNRSLLVRRRVIRELHSEAGRYTTVVLDQGQRFRIGAAYRDALMYRLGIQGETTAAGQAVD